jgi:hypothetical protein
MVAGELGRRASRGSGSRAVGDVADGSRRRARAAPRGRPLPARYEFSKAESERLRELIGRVSSALEGSAVES